MINLYVCGGGGRKEVEMKQKEKIMELKEDQHQEETQMSSQTPH